MGVLRRALWGWGRGRSQLLTRLCGVHLQASPAKKARAGQEDPGTPPSSPLSPEQLVRIQRNKAAALLRLAARNVPVGFGESWKKPLSAEFGKPYFIKLMGFVAEERKHYTVYPPPHQVFTWTQMCDIRHVKVVILGQDPYHGPNQAHGLCFSVQRPVPPPPSLENIYKELSTDIDGFVHPGHGDLSGWAKQGVLLLNAVLTVRAHQANSHKERGWEQFTDAVVSWLNQNSSGLVFLLWGSYAQKKGSAIDRAVTDCGVDGWNGGQRGGGTVGEVVGGRHQSQALAWAAGGHRIHCKTSPCAADCAPLPVVGLQRVLWV
ncbi:uracil-DNA glycosylase isoform X1 [Vulpes lagopus]|uniref:uracil-DNA glycosylase isoform X1 n=1 Tax=Vulpes lagopus TaxID=494514 RepID=UPI001BCA2D60|nr:uracil-DNA glycosylase isoform X1 [Vulpes lagopus]